MENIRSAIDRVLAAVCCFLFAAMVVIGTYQIVTRYVFNSPSTVSEELLTYTFTWMALLASAYVFGKREHMRVAFIADHLKGKARMILEVIIEVLTIAVAAVVFFYGGVSIMELTMTQKTASLGVPMGVIYTVVPLTGALICIYGLFNIADLVSGTDRRAQKKEKE